jgi:hypothetical protein
MAWSVVKGVGNSIVENPADAVTTLSAMMFPVMAILGGAQFITSKLNSFITAKTFGQRGLEFEDKIFGSHQIRR